MQLMAPTERRALRTEHYATSDAGSRQLIAEFCGNHQARRAFHFSERFITGCLEIRLVAPHANIPAALFELRCYSDS